MKRLIFLPILIGLMCGACSKKSPVDAKFEEINILCDTDPHIAMSMLDSIDYGVLSTADRHRYDLLSIKSRDKAYVRHASDSLILDVVEYYDGHRKSGLYPEALYYGGRVYSDIGDLPTALEFFQKALNAMQDDNYDIRSKSKILSQTGRLLESLRLHSQAIPYIKESISLSYVINDSASLFYDEMLLSSLYINCDSLQQADYHLTEASRYSSIMQPEDIALLETEKASLYLGRGDIDSALISVRPSLQSADTLCRNLALSVATNIYKAAAKSDSAYICAKELALSPCFNNRIYGFSALFSPELSSALPKDSIAFFVQAYNKHMEDYINRYEVQDSLIQNSRYNYSQHLRYRNQAEQEKMKIERQRNRAVVYGGLVTVILILIWIGMKYRSLRKKCLKFMSEINLLKAITPVRRIIGCKNNAIVSESICCEVIDEPLSEGEQLKKDLLDDINRQSTDSDCEPADSTVVEKLKTFISQEKCIPAKDRTIWKDIEEAIDDVTSGFHSKLMVLTLGRMTQNEYEVALLIKCGFKPKEISILLAKAKSTVAERRSALSNKIFGEVSGNKQLDKIILRL